MVGKAASLVAPDWGAILGSGAFFKIKLNCLLDTLIRKIYFLIIKINNFRGDLSDISAKTGALVLGPLGADLGPAPL